MRGSWRGGGVSETTLNGPHCNVHLSPLPGGKLLGPRDDTLEFELNLNPTTSDLLPVGAGARQSFAVSHSQMYL